MYSGCRSSYNYERDEKKINEKKRKYTFYSQVCFSKHYWETQSTHVTERS